MNIQINKLEDPIVYGCSEYFGTTYLYESSRECVGEETFLTTDRFEIVIGENRKIVEIKRPHKLKTKYSDFRINKIILGRLNKELIKFIDELDPINNKRNRKDPVCDKCNFYKDNCRCKHFLHTYKESESELCKLEPSPLMLADYKERVLTCTK